MSRSFLFRFVVQSGLAVLFTAAMTVLSVSEFAAGQETKKQRDNEEEARSDLPFRVYAQWAIDGFDADKDGSLTKEEMQGMQSPLLEDRYDQNKNGKLSFDEIVNAIRRPSSAKVKEQPTEKSSRASEEARQVKYAKSLIKSYDKDKDGFIGMDERKKMRRPIAESADSNKDGLFSLNEISASLVAMSPDPAGAKQVLVIKGDLDLEADAITRRFLAASLKKNDKNQDGTLDAGEIAQARWSTYNWQDSDSNEDGMLSSEELKARYKKLVSSMMTGSRRPQEPSKSTPLTREQADELMAMWTDAARSSRTPLRQTYRGAARNNMAGSGDMMGGSGDLLGGLLGSASNRSSANRNKESKKTFVNIELYLLRMPFDSEPDRVTKMVKALRESDEPTGAAVRALADRLGIASYDQLVFTAMTGDTTEVQSGASVPVITGASQNSRGRTYNRNSFDVGLQTKVTPRLTENGIILALNMQKSDVIVTEIEDQDVPDNSVVNWTYDSSIEIKPGKPAIIRSSSSRQHWILVVGASQAE